MLLVDPPVFSVNGASASKLPLEHYDEWNHDYVMVLKETIMVTRIHCVSVAALLAVSGCSQTSASSASGADAQDAATSSSGADAAFVCVDPSSYSRSCTSASDCALVPSCATQKTCRSCADTAISNSALPAFQAALAAEPPPPPNGCGPCVSVVAQCRDGGCAVTNE